MSIIYFLLINKLVVENYEKICKKINRSARTSQISLLNLSSTNIKNDYSNALNKLIDSDSHNNIIILADDNDLINNCNKKIISKVLNEIGKYDYDILSVNDGIDIIKIFIDNLENKKIKLIISDENMDYLNGSDAIRFIRKLEKVKNLTKTKIVSLSCHEDNKIKEYIFNEGADYILTKPLTKLSIRAILEEISLLIK